MWRLLLPKPALELLALGLRNLRLFGVYNPTEEYRLTARQWNFEQLQEQLGDPSSFDPRDPYAARRRFVDINHYVDIQLSAVVMENLFIQAGSLELRATPFPARSFTPSKKIRCRTMAVIDLGDENISDKYHGTLDNYLELGQDVAICFHPPPTHAAKGSTKARKLDNPMWMGRVVSAPRRFKAGIPRESLCILLYISGDHPPPIAIADVGTYAGYNSSLRPYEVYLRLEDTSKAARRNFNGIARLAPPPVDDLWVRDGDSEVDFTGVHQPAGDTLSRGHSPTSAIEGIPAPDPNQAVSTVAVRGSDTFHSVICGMKAEPYFEYDMLSGVEPATRDRILSDIHPTRRARRSDYLPRIPCGVLLVHGAPGCAKSVQLAVAMVLCVAQQKPVLFTASRHEAVDACLRKVEGVIQRSGLDCIIIRAFDAAKDKAACRRVFQHRDEWRNAEFKIRSKWRPHLSVAFWVAYFLGLEPSPWTGRRLDATTSPDYVRGQNYNRRDLHGKANQYPNSLSRVEEDSARPRSLQVLRAI